MELINKLKEQMAQLLTGVNSKELIEQIGAINSTIQGVEEEAVKLSAENMQLLSDYKNAIMHQSTPANQEPSRSQAEAPKIEDFLQNIK